jgi:MerR family redox-sensitive transcriptional activator SoxR
MAPSFLPFTLELEVRFKSSHDLSMRIGAVARQTGLRTSAIRYYERLGLLPRAQRENSQRSYGEDVLVRLEVIRGAVASGFTLQEVRKLFAGRPYSARLRRLAAAKIDELDRSIERSRTMQGLLKRALRCRCLTIEECGRRMLAARRG